MPVTYEDVLMFIQKGDVWSWATLLGVAFGGAILIRFTVKVLSTRLRILSSRTAFKWDDILVNMIASTRGYVIFVWLFNALEGLMTITPRADRISDIVTVAVTALQIVFWGLEIIRGWHTTYLEQRVQRDASSAAALGLIYTGLRAAFIGIVILTALNNIGVDVHAFVAGLGVGGIAIALAAQTILADLLASFSIVLDKPFVVGDFIVVGNLNGVVENIGIKTTRVRALSGEQIVFSNKDLLGSRVQNFKTMWQRRVVQKFSVTYDTPSEKLRQIPGWIRGFVEAEPKLKFDRCHFAYYATSSLDYELVFLVTDPDYNVYMDLQQELFLRVLEKFADEGVSFAFPTQSLKLDPTIEAERKTLPRA